jgi:hypothetical protein
MEYAGQRDAVLGDQFRISLPAFEDLKGDPSITFMHQQIGALE